MVVSVEDLPVEKRSVLVRVDYNVPLRDGRIEDDTRIRASLQTLGYLRERGARTILLSHLGRPKGKVQKDLSLRPVARHLEGLLGEPVLFAETLEDAEEKVKHLQPGQVLLLENLRFHPEEEKNDPAFSRRLASLGEIFINDAFSVSHRAHASTVGIVQYGGLPCAAGFSLLKEVAALDRLLHPQRPFVAVVGGAKISDKLESLQALVDRVDGLLLGGAMANTFLLALGYELGDSLVEPEARGHAWDLLQKAYARDVRVVLPDDLVVAKAGDIRVVEAKAGVPAGYRALDIGPKTLEAYRQALQGAATVFWNGPLGLVEEEPFHEGSVGLARILAESSAFRVAGGGDSLALLRRFHLTHAVDHMSLGGGASLEYLRGDSLPGIQVLQRGKDGQP
ncbi:MAG: phosphoglycerate kinase [Clostridiales bacterium]|nr:phosphoglycerate kinase [Clostridiales bacterium]